MIDSLIESWIKHHEFIFIECGQSTQQPYNFSGLQGEREGEGGRCQGEAGKGKHEAQEPDGARQQGEEEEEEEEEEEFYLLTDSVPAKRRPNFTGRNNSVQF